MTARYDYAKGSDRTYDTHNPAAPAEAVGSYAILDEAETQAVIARANAAAAEWARVPGLGTRPAAERLSRRRGCPR